MFSPSLNSASVSEEVGLSSAYKKCAATAADSEAGHSPSSGCSSHRDSSAAKGEEMLLLKQKLQQEADSAAEIEANNKDRRILTPSHAAPSGPAELIISQQAAAQNLTNSSCDGSSERGIGCMRVCCRRCCCCAERRRNRPRELCCRSSTAAAGGAVADSIEGKRASAGISNSNSIRCCRSNSIRCCRSSCCSCNSSGSSSCCAHNSPSLNKGVSSSSASAGKWQKILWKKQPHPDCYVDETFLNALMRNANLTRYMYSDLCKSTVVLTQHLSCILIFSLIYKMIVKKTIAASTLVVFDVVSLPLGYALRWSLKPAPRAARQVLQSAIIVFGVLRILAPVLQTLTQSFSDDTVISLTSICLLIHIPLNDYSYVYRNPEKIDEPLGRLMSLNVALFANVLLASRLSTSTEVFAFLFFGIEVFALAPMARRYLLLWNSWACTYVVTPLLILLTSALVYLEGSGSNVLLYLLLMFFITFVGPYWLIRSQKYKNEISGPWDIPCVKNYT